MSMKGIRRLQGAANTAEARRDYIRLLAVAARVGKMNLIPDLPADSGWRKISTAAKYGVEALLKACPDLRQELAEIYPGFVEGDQSR